MPAGTAKSQPVTGSYPHLRGAPDRELVAHLVGIALTRGVEVNRQRIPTARPGGADPDPLAPVNDAVTVLVAIAERHVRPLVQKVAAAKNQPG